MILLMGQVSGVTNSFFRNEKRFRDSRKIVVHFAGVRDYIHIMDLAAGHVKAMVYQKASNSTGFKAINLGTGKGYSVLEVVQAFEKASGRKIECKIVERRPGDISASYADASLANKELGWRATRDISVMCKLFRERLATF